MALDQAPFELDLLLHKQLESVLSSANQSTTAALELLAITPSSLPIKVLAEFAQTDEVTLTESLRGTALIETETQKNRLQYSSELAREQARKRLGPRAKLLIEKLINLLREQFPDEDALLTSLLHESKDYAGLQLLLSNQSLLKTIESRGDLSVIINRLRLAAVLAKENHDDVGLVRWSLGISIAKAFIEDLMNESEIKALTSIGNSGEALRRAYSMPQPGSKIRLLARIYASIKEQGGKVPKEAQDELRTMVENLDFSNMDEDIANELAFDLLPVLTDVAFGILEKVSKQREGQNIFEAALDVMASKLKRQGEDAHAIIGERHDIRDISTL